MIIETLRKTPIFFSLKDDELKSISKYFKELHYKNDAYAFMEGDRPDGLFIVAEGNIKIVKHTLAGKDIILEVMSPGDIFGGVAVLDKKDYPASAQAIKPSTAIRINRQDLLTIMDDYPILKLELVNYFSDKLRDAHEMLKNIATERVEKRIAALLLKLSEKTGIEDMGYKKIGFALTRRELAEMVGTTVETCIRVMSKFQKQGVVKSTRDTILVKTAPLKKILEN